MDYRELQDFANAIRCLSIDMVNKAKSGHQGAAMGFADVTSVLFNGGMNFAPGDETRDRLILSAGHASAMLYSAIYLSQKTDITIEDLKKFRQLGARCQGHPILDKELGVEMTTGALGQGLGTAVGIAIALKKKKLESKVFAIVGDGCLMEGISYEAAALASSLNLDNLIVLFDDNDICIDGKASYYAADNLVRFKACGFEVFRSDGHNYRKIIETIRDAKKAKRPVFVAFKTKIGQGSVSSGNSLCHGYFVMEEEARKIRKQFGFPEEPFTIPKSMEASFGRGGASAQFQTARALQASPVSLEAGASFQKTLASVREEISNIKPLLNAKKKPRATRYFSGLVFEKLASKFPLLIGGSADLSESTRVFSKNSVPINRSYFDGNYIHYGVREHAMGCVMNGLTLEGFIPFGSTFLVFSDYMKPAVRNAALMKIAPIFIFTHDSIGVGEDGITHQPIEQLAALRATPNINVFRPCCGVEVAECIELAIQNRETPSALILSRQSFPNIQRVNIEDNLSAAGIYKISPFALNGKEQLTIIASGSETSLAFDIKNAVLDFDIQIYSAPCFELFDRQPYAYKTSVLSGRKLIMEAGSSTSLYKYRTRENDIILGLDEFGESGTSEDLFSKFGFTVENVKGLIGG
ncbi:MAG: transketolase [Holosporales bacterium]|jgi:transketolase|nr:transketolase [Holosporales bacterium]